LIIDRYVTREIALPTVLIGGLLSFLFVGYSTTRHLAEATESGIPYADVFQLIGYETLIAIEMLLPMALFLAVIIGIGRLHAENEIIALANAGCSERRILRIVAIFALGVAILVGLLSIFGRPWAYEYVYQMKAQAKDDFDLNKIKAEHFYSIEKDKDSSFVIYAETVNPEMRELGQVFFSATEGTRRQMIRSHHAIRPATKPGEQRVLTFYDGYSYDLDQRKPIDLVLKFGEMTIPIGASDNSVGYRAKSASTSALSHSEKPKDIAEFQWRLTRPLATILLACVAVPIARVKPRQGRYGKAVIAIILYAIYFNLTGMAKSWVKDDVVGVVPGLWWPECLLGLLLIVLLLIPTIKLQSSSRRHQPLVTK
jgi:lipopolysaccharide export system permease protein